LLAIRVRQKTPKTTNPFKDITDKYLVAKALIAGEIDRNKMLKELGVRTNTVYNVATELTRNGYVLPIHEKKPNFFIIFIIILIIISPDHSEISPSEFFGWLTGWTH
jgi:hypothetical protein